MIMYLMTDRPVGTKGHRPWTNVVQQVTNYDEELLTNRFLGMKKGEPESARDRACY